MLPILWKAIVLLLAAIFLPVRAAALSQNVSLLVQHNVTAACVHQVETAPVCENDATLFARGSSAERGAAIFTLLDARRGAARRSRARFQTFRETTTRHDVAGTCRAL